MSIEQLKELFGNHEAILELVQLEGGELALRNAGSEKEPLVKIQFNDDVKAVNGNLKLTPFTLKQQSKIDPFDDLLRLNLWLNSYSLFIF